MPSAQPAQEASTSEPSKSPPRGQKRTADNAELSPILDKSNPERPFLCPYCPLRCPQKNTVRIHIRARHTNQRKHQCPSCSYNTADPSCLNKHRKRKHGWIPPSRRTDGFIAHHPSGSRSPSPPPPPPPPPRVPVPLPHPSQYGPQPYRIHPIPQAQPVVKQEYPNYRWFTHPVFARRPQLEPASWSDSDSDSEPEVERPAEPDAPPISHYADEPRSS
ncbi:hypothetical protein EV715DRAFT_273344 [Schizophyllum commune]